MAYVTTVALKPILLTNNGSESIEFAESDCTWKEEDVSFATGYFNPITGSYDLTKSTLNFESGEILIINQDYVTTSAQLIALN